MVPWAKIIALHAQDRRLTAEAALRLVQAWLMLRIVPFRMLTATVSVRDASHRDMADIRPIREAIARAVRHLPVSMTCLPQAFAAVWMLQARGARPHLLYGVAKTDTGFEAHAWVEVDGQPVVGHGVAARFAVLAIFPSSPEDVA